MRTAFWGVLLVALALLLPASGMIACGGLPDEAAAELNGALITNAQVVRRIEGLRMTYGPIIPLEDADGDGEPDCEFMNFRRDTALQLVQEELERQEAESRQISISDADIDNAIQKTADDGFLGDVDQLMQSYFDRGFSEEELRDDVERTLRRERLIAEVIGEIDISEDDIREYYERNIDQYQQPERRTVNMFVTNDQATAQSAVERARAGEDFVSLADELSTEQPGEDSLGPVRPGDLPDELDRLVFSLEPLVVPDPVQIGAQWYVIRVEAVISPVNIPLEQVKENIIEFAGKEKEAEVWREFIDAVYAEAAIEYNSNYDPELRDGQCQQQ